MTPFQQELAKIVVDKVLLGVIAACFGFYLSRLLEDYRSRNSYLLTLHNQRIEAWKTMVRIISKHHENMMGLFEIIERVAHKHRQGEKASTEDEKAGSAYIDNYHQLVSQTSPSLPLLSYDMAQALIAYIEETNKVSDIIKGKLSADLPTKESLDLAFLRFLFSYQKELLDDDPLAKRKPAGPEVVPISLSA